MAARTFPLDIEGVGAFVFRERTMLDHVHIEQEVRRQTAGLTDQDLILAVEATVTLPRLIVDGPPDFNPAELDPLDRNSWIALGAVYGGLRKAEEDFRADRAAKRAGMGRRPGGDGGVPVPAPLQPAAE